MAQQTWPAGPWHVGNSGLLAGLIVYDRDGNAVADARVFHGKHDGSVVAALIASVPTMIDALRAIASGETDPAATAARTLEKLGI